MKGTDTLSRRHPFLKQEPPPIALDTILYRTIGDDTNTVQARKFSWLNQATQQTTHVVLDAENNPIDPDVPMGLEPIPAGSGSDGDTATDAAIPLSLVSFSVSPNDGGDGQIVAWGGVVQEPDGNTKKVFFDDKLNSIEENELPAGATGHEDAVIFNSSW